MKFDLKHWLENQAGNYGLEVPLCDVANAQADDRREWLVTNGLGSFASGNIWGANTRRYHGLLTSSLAPPVRRTSLFSRIDEVVDGQELATNFWQSGSVGPEGYRSVDAFSVYPVPTWAFAVSGGTLVKQVAMVNGRQEVVAGYTWQGEKPVRLQLHLLVNHRDFHNQTRGAGDWDFEQQVGEDSVLIKAFQGAQELELSFSAGTYRQEPCWYWSYYWPREHERGLPETEDNFHIGVVEVELAPGENITIHAGLPGQVSTLSIDEAVGQVVQYQNRLLEAAGNPDHKDVQYLVLAADQFVCHRESTGGSTIIAGYPWFGDWGRDSMISLPGLCLSTGRADVARQILETFGKYLSEGMLPNNFPDSGQSPDYNTSDATFWWAWALRKYHQATGDLDFVKQQLRLMDSVVDWHLKGTRYGLHVDESDGLVTGGSPGVQLTWMDAKVGNYVVTPRHGKAVEINALWFNFLKILNELHGVAGGDCGKYEDLASRVKAGFQKFWNEQTGCLSDVIRDDGRADAAVRPNQLLAISLPYQLLDAEKALSVLEIVERELLTPVGLRTLSPADDAYEGRYGGEGDVADQWARDVTYHQGTAWTWLIGAWVDARLKLHGQEAENCRFISDRLSAIRSHILAEAGVGSVSEIFDGNKPHRPVGCYAQAWSVAEPLRVLSENPRLQ